MINSIYNCSFSLQGSPSNDHNSSIHQLCIIYTLAAFFAMVWLLVNEAKGKRPRPRKDVKNYTANIPIRTLPPELERDIFEMAVQQYPKDAAKMARVARRVQDWVEPIMYAKVVLNHWFPHADSEMVRLFLRTIESRPPTFFAKHVKSLYLNVHTQEAARIISVCTGVENLVCCDALWSTTHGQSMYLPSILALSPRRLSVSLKRIFPPSQTPNFSHSLFANMTHLQVTDRLAFAMWPKFRLPRLTHLAFPYSPGRDPANHIIKQQVRDILSNCRAIRVLVLTTSCCDNTPRLLMSDEPRAVIVHCRVSRLEFGAFEKGEADYWVRAEQFVALHRRTSRYRSYCN